jgi:hypothetical protein
MCVWYIWQGEEGNEIGYTALKGTRIWLWDIRSGRRGYGGEEITMGMWLWNIGMGLERGTRQWESGISSS